jgi:hypothetical protein
MAWHEYAVFCVVLIPALATHPPIARRIVYLPGAAWFAGGSVLFAAVGILLKLTDIIEPRLSVPYFVPLAQFALVQVLFRLFVRFQGREPADTFFNRERGLDFDRAYAIFVWLGGILPFIYAMSLLT